MWYYYGRPTTKQDNCVWCTTRAWIAARHNRQLAAWRPILRQDIQQIRVSLAVLANLPLYFSPAKIHSYTVHLYIDITALPLFWSDFVPDNCYRILVLNSNSLHVFHPLISYLNGVKTPIVSTRIQPAYFIPI